MATLYITEFRSGAGLGQGAGMVPGMFPSGQQPPVAQQTVALSTSSAASAAFDDQTALVRIAADTDCFVLFGADPTSTVEMMYLPAGAAEYYGVPMGGSFKVAGITAA